MSHLLVGVVSFLVGAAAGALAVVGVRAHAQRGRVPPPVAGAETDAREIERLRHYESSFHSLAAASPVGIFRTDARGACQYCNETWQAITGLDADEARDAGWAR